MTRRGGATRLVRLGLVAIVLATSAHLVAPIASRVAAPAASAASSDTVRILIGAADDLDPAAQGDIGSAAISAQLFEGLTAIDAQLQTRPALASSWDFRDGGATVVFHLRPGITFSDGTPITAADVVRSWFRIIDPAHPSPLVSLIGDVQGALAFARGETADKATVGLAVEGDDVVARLSRPATDFPTIVAGPTFAVVPAGDRRRGRGSPAGRHVRRQRRLHPRGGERHDDDPHRQRAVLGGPPGDHDDRAGPRHRRPQLGRRLRGRRRRPRRRVAVRRDLAGLRRRARPAAAPDRRPLAPVLRLRHVAAAVRRRPGPPGVRPGGGLAAADRAVRRRRRDARDRDGPAGDPRAEHDGLPAGSRPGRRAPAARRRRLSRAAPASRRSPSSAAAGPTGRSPRRSPRELGVDRQCRDPGAGLLRPAGRRPALDLLDGLDRRLPGPERLPRDPPRQPAPRTTTAAGRPPRSTGPSPTRWRRATPTAARAAFDRAEGIVRDEAPTIPLTYDVGWSLARAGLLGAYDNGLGIIRMAGLAWDR